MKLQSTLLAREGPRVDGPPRRQEALREVLDRRQLAPIDEVVAQRDRQEALEARVRRVRAPRLRHGREVVVVEVHPAA